MRNIWTARNTRHYRTFFCLFSLCKWLFDMEPQEAIKNYFFTKASPEVNLREGDGYFKIK